MPTWRTNHQSSIFTGRAIWIIGDKLIGIDAAGFICQGIAWRQTGKNPYDLVVTFINHTVFIGITEHNPSVCVTSGASSNAV
jgi:hypothetical protein